MEEVVSFSDLFGMGGGVYLKEGKLVNFSGEVLIGQVSDRDFEYCQKCHKAYVAAGSAPTYHDRKIHNGQIICLKCYLIEKGGKLPEEDIIKVIKQTPPTPQETKGGVRVEKKIERRKWIADDTDEADELFNSVKHLLWDEKGVEKLQTEYAIAQNQSNKAYTERMKKLKPVKIEFGGEIKKVMRTLITHNGGERHVTEWVGRPKNLRIVKNRN